MELTGPHPAGARVHLSPDGVLVWPVMLLYPEYGQSDYIEAFKETDRFIDHLEVMFQTPPAWDVDRKYGIGTMQLYYEDVSTCCMCKVDTEETLSSVLQRSSYTVVSGTPAFLVLSALSPFTNHFLNKR
jgi:hypothetical protein